MEKNKFWMVWNESGRAPTRKHKTIRSAEDEAHRLANLYKGNTFIVLESVEECSYGVMWKEH
jgi:hypothetical protein